METITTSPEFKKFKKLCEKSQFKFFFALTPDEHDVTGAYAEGNISIKSLGRILELKKNPPVEILVDLPKLPVDYASLYKCGNQATMLSFANQLLGAYIDPTPIGTGKINFYPKIYNKYRCFDRCKLNFKGVSFMIIHVH